MTWEARESFAWVAGFFDGEGCFSARPDGYPVASIAQLHRQPLERVQGILRVGYIRGPISNKGNSNPYFDYRTHGYERVQHIAASLWPWLTDVKRDKAITVLTRARTVPSRRSFLKEGVPLARDRTHCPQGHPYDTENTHYTKEGKRHCRRCARDRAELTRRQAGIEPRTKIDPARRFDPHLPTRVRGATIMRHLQADHADQFPWGEPTYDHQFFRAISAHWWCHTGDGTIKISRRA